MRLSILSKLLILLTDGLFSFFLFQIFAGLIAYFYYIPDFQGCLVTWISYYIISYLIWRRTFGQCFFDAGIVDDGKGRSFLLRLILRESTSSLPAVMLLLFGWNYLSPIRVLAVILICSVLAIFRKKIFKISIERIGRRSLLDEKHSIRRFTAIFLSLMVLASTIRIINTMATNDGWFLKEKPLYAVPRPSSRSVKKYVDFLKESKTDINDYIFGLFDRYDHVILCERHHNDMTQYDMIYNLVTDSQFVDGVGTVFTEVGCVDARDAYKAFVDKDFSTDEEVERNLASFMTLNQSVHLLWPNTNWFNFLKKMYYFNHRKDKKVDILFSDRNWLDRSELDYRDSIMADNIISTLRADSLQKSLIIMNYRHAYLTPGNCGYYISRAFPGKVANVMINFGGVSTLAMLSGKEMPLPTHYGKWDVAFEQLEDSDCAFDFEGSPFGDDDFDHFVLPWNPVCALRYKDMFTGFIHYKAPTEHYFCYGYNHIFDLDNEKRLRVREAELEGYSLDYWKEYLKDGIQRQEGVDVYFEYGLFANRIYFMACMLAFIVLGIIALISHIRVSSIRKANK